MIKIFNFIWRCAIAVGLFFVWREMHYIAGLLTSYVRMLLEMGSF